MDKRSYRIAFVLLKVIVLEYNKAMLDYQKKTGGGDGDEALFVSREERDQTKVFDYDVKVKYNMQLTITYICDKQYNFPLTLRVDTISEDAAIDDDAQDH